MEKAELYSKVKKYCNILDNTVKSNKKNKRQNTGHLIFEKGNNPVIVTTSALLIFLGLGFSLYAFAGLPPYIAIPVGTASALTTSIGLPKLLHYAILHGKGKFARGYAKMELDNYFVAFKDYIKQHQKAFLQSNKYDEVPYADIEQIEQVFENCTENYKATLDKLVGKTIFKRNKQDLKKVARVLKTVKDEEKAAKKIEKIVGKNEKFVKPWCDLYNKCGSIAKNLYDACNDMNPNFVVPAVNSFVADSYFVSRKVDHYLKNVIGAVEVSANVTFEDDTTKVENKYDSHRTSKYEKIRQYLSKKESKSREESFER